MDKALAHYRLKRWGAKQPIADSVMTWNGLDDAVTYFRNQRLSNLEVLHFIEIESCDKLINLLGITRTVFNELIMHELEN